jgi:hypothetical protein
MNGSHERSVKSTARLVRVRNLIVFQLNVII